jgi:hypothetical protein
MVQKVMGQLDVQDPEPLRRLNMEYLRRIIKAIEPDATISINLGK